MEREIFVIAGGTGLIGRALRDHLTKNGHEVRVLTRQKSDPANGLYHWNPSLHEMDEQALVGMTRLINLAGVGIADKRWSPARKKEILSSRVEPTLFLAEKCQSHPTLQHYISASGINCYDTTHPDKLYRESDPFATDYLSTVVRDWEAAADAFQRICAVSKIRISVVLTPQGGALAQMSAPFRFFMGAGLGTGKQWLPWIHYMDLVRMIEFAALRNTGEVYNALGENVSNKGFMVALGKAMKRPLWLPNLPGFVLKLALGEMAAMLLKGIQASNQKVKEAGFQFAFERLEDALADLYK